MSFSANIKEELSKLSNLTNKEALKLEFFGYLISTNTTVIKNKIKYSTENLYNINRFNKLLTNLNIDYQIDIQGKVYTISLKKQNFEMLEYIKDKINIKPIFEIKKQDEIKSKAIVRGTFLGGGSISDPNSKYHLEILFSTKINLDFIVKILKNYNIQVKTLKRKKNFLIYIKEAEEISKYLAFIGANRAVLSFEEIRVLRQTRNNVNRLVNCETANLNKTINAAVEQVNAIKYLKEKKQFDKLNDNLKEIANLRIKNSSATLTQLGQMLKEPIGKSGVNHRLKKICEMAQELKKKH